MEVFLLLCLSFVIGAVCAFWCANRAVHKGYNPVVWGILGFVVPIISVVVMVVLPPTDRAR